VARGTPWRGMSDEQILLEAREHVEAWTAEIFSNLDSNTSDLSSSMATEAISTLWRRMWHVQELTKARWSADGGESSIDL
jgi:hypothetical protein